MSVLGGITLVMLLEQNSSEKNKLVDTGRVG